MNTNQIIPRDPADLRISSLLNSIPEWQPTDPRFVALKKDIRDRGIIEPLIVDPDGRILSGRKRWQAAKAWQMEAVPTIVYTGNDPAGLIIATLNLRAHYTKSALAYITYPLFADAHKAALDRNLAFMKNGGKGTVSFSNGNGLEKGVDSVRNGLKTAQDLADRMGVNRDLFDQAAKLHKIFAEDTETRTITNKETGETFQNITFKDYYEPLIYAGQVKLGAVIAGMAGSKATNSKAKPVTGQMELVFEGFEVLEKRLSRCAGWNIEQFEELIPVMDQTAEAFPPAMRKLFIKALKRAERAQTVE